MKNFIIMLLIISMLLTGTVVYSKELNNKLVGKVIIIDAGHGGKDSGTTVGKIYEKDINLAIALLLKDELIKKGVTVLLTRDGDYDLSSPNVDRRKKNDFDNRINLINNSNADLYLSIHVNYLENGKYYGAQTFYTKGNEVLADVIQESLISNLNSPLKEKLLSNTIYMYKHLQIPGVLIECGFLSNSAERTKLNTLEYQKDIVFAIVKGLISYF